MIFGILGHAARFFIFAIGDPLALMIAINILHGFCYAFFFASVYIFVDEYFPRDSRASAQGLFNLLILGMGPFIGALLWGKLADILSRWRAPSTSTSCSSTRRPRRGGRAVAARRVPPEGEARGSGRVRTAVAAALLSSASLAAAAEQYPQHDRSRPAPTIVAPGAAVSTPAPADAVVLFDGRISGSGAPRRRRGPPRRGRSRTARSRW
jgi:hypothetical protein